MKQILFLLLFSCLFFSVSAQKKVYTIQADSVKITNCDSAELIIENHTQDVKGFLYNTGNGRTIFKKGVIKVSDSLYLIGSDSLKLNAWLQGGNKWGKTGILGTYDNNHLDLYTNSVARLRLTNSGNLLLGSTTDNGNLLQVAGNTRLDGKFFVEGTSSIADGSWHSRYEPTLNMSTSPTGGIFGMIFSPTINFNGTNQVAYPVSILPTFNVGTKGQATDGISSALYIKSILGGIRIDQSSSAFGNTGQPLFIYQDGTTNKEQMYLYRNANLSDKAFIWMNDNRPAGGQGYMVPVIRNTINLPSAGGGVSWLMERVSYKNEASIQMLYETTPDSTANLNTSISFNTSSNGGKYSAVYINGTNIGMGTKTPTAQLHTTGTVRFAGLTNDSTQTRVIVSDATGKLYYRSASSLASEGILYSSLAVNGPIKARSLRLEPAGIWPDYVFDSAYHLPALKDVEERLRRDHHLSGVATAQEVAEKGIDVGDHQAVLLKKIEELTLYAIAQDKKIDVQHEDAVAMRKLLEAQAAELDALKKEIADMKKKPKDIRK